MSSDDLFLELPWVEKYRPQEFETIISQNFAINNLKKFIESKALPHLIFNGPAGTGKTSSALILARKLLGDNCKEMGLLLELNASDEVRMGYIREVLKEFVSQSQLSGALGGKRLKMVILDEADNIPSTVQQALRRIIEKFSGNVIFIFLCNYINKLIDPIISRCAVLRFAPLNKEKVIQRLQFIVKSEKLKIPNEKDLLDRLYFISEGDLRKAINTLQMAVSLDLLSDLRFNEIFEISGYANQKTVDEIFQALKDKDSKKLKQIIEEMKGYSSRNLIRQILIKLTQEMKFDDNTLAILFDIFGEYDYRMTMGADNEIQMIALLNSISKELK